LLFFISKNLKKYCKKTKRMILYPEFDRKIMAIRIYNPDISRITYAYFSSESCCYVSHFFVFPKIFLISCNVRFFKEKSISMIFPVCFYIWS
jgi:hypothetical protein